MIKVILFCGCAAIVSGCSWTNSMIFQPPRISYTADDCELIANGNPKTSRVAVRYFHNPGARYVLLYSHGNAEDIGRLFPLMEMFRKSGFSVLCYDYPGYGLSAGEPTEKSVYASADAAYTHLTTRLNIPKERIIIVGRSIGSGPATYLAEKRAVAGLVLISPLVSAYRVITKFPLIPFDKFRNLSRIDEIGMPLLILHGTRDGVIPIWHGVKLFKEAEEPKFFYSLEGLGHNDLFHNGKATIFGRIHEFADKLQHTKAVGQER